MLDWLKQIELDDVLEVADKGLDVARVVAGANPVAQAMIAVADMAVETKTKGVGVDNALLLEQLKILVKSTHNDADDDLLCLVESYLECKKKSK